MREADPRDVRLAIVSRDDRRGRRANVIERRRAVRTPSVVVQSANERTLARRKRPPRHSCAPKNLFSFPRFELPAFGRSSSLLVLRRARSETLPLTTRRVCEKPGRRRRVGQTPPGEPTRERNVPDGIFSENLFP